MSFRDDRMIETLGDDALGWDRADRWRHRRRRRHHRYGQPGQPGWQPGQPGQPGYPGVPYGAPATTAPAASTTLPGQPYPGAIPTPPGNWPGGTYPPAGWQPGQPLPGYPTGWPPPGAPWPGTYNSQPVAAPQLAAYDPYGNPVYSEYIPPVQAPVAAPVPTGPQPTIDVTVGEALMDGVSMTEIVGCLKKAGYTTRQISSIVGRCCGWG